MGKIPELEAAVVDAWLAQHEGWERVRAGKTDALAHTFTFSDFSAALGFVVRVGLAAEKHDHHPDVELGWGRARIVWSTHDAGGISERDLRLAEATDRLAT